MQIIYNCQVWIYFLVRLQIKKLMKIYMVINFRARGISRDARKLVQTSMLIKKIVLSNIVFKPVIGLVQ